MALRDVDVGHDAQGDDVGHGDCRHDVARGYLRGGDHDALHHALDDHHYDLDDEPHDLRDPHDVSYAIQGLGRGFDLVLRQQMERRWLSFVHHVSRYWLSFALRVSGDRQNGDQKRLN